MKEGVQHVQVVQDSDEITMLRDDRFAKNEFTVTSDLMTPTYAKVADGEPSEVDGVKKLTSFEQQISIASDATKYPYPESDLTGLNDTNMIVESLRFPPSTQEISELDQYSIGPQEAARNAVTSQTEPDGPIVSEKEGETKTSPILFVLVGAAIVYYITRQ